MLTLIERHNIHQSCRSIEGVVNCLNDYCQIIDSLTDAQRKLAKSLREVASVRGTLEVASSGLQAVANILDSLAEIDSRFVKLADKECENLSSDVKKWFKKLAKEEKGHDEKVANANLKIKQAGLAYEKKAKRRDSDALIEHTRYVNLLGAVGSEVSQEKHNHTLSVTNQHTTLVQSVASCITRLAVAEWNWSCEYVRGFSPAIGRIGELRAFLEGGWTGAMLPSTNPNGHTNSFQQEDTIHRKSITMGPRASEQLNPTHLPPWPHQAPFRAESDKPSSPGVSTDSLHRKLAGEMDKNVSVRSIESLSSFPIPPKYLPLPELQVNRSSSIPSSPGKSAKELVSPIDTHTRKMNDSFSDRRPGLTESPVSFVPERMTSLDPGADTSHSQAAYNVPPPDMPNLVGMKTTSINFPPANHIPPSPGYSDPMPIHSLPDSLVTVDERVKKGALERRVSQSGSMVAAVRERLVRGSQGPISSPPPDMPSPSPRVSDLANRYTSSGDSTSTSNMQPPPVEHEHAVQRPNTAKLSSSLAPAETPHRTFRPRSSVEQMNAEERNPQNLTRESSHEFRTRVPETGGMSAVPRSLLSSKLPVQDQSYPSMAPRSHSQDERSTYSNPPDAHQRSSLGSFYGHHQEQPAAHGPCPGCHVCSPHDHQTTGSHHPLPHATRTGPVETQKGWRRRLSMPVVSVTFSVDSKKNKNHSNALPSPIKPLNGGITSSLVKAASNNDVRQGLADQDPTVVTNSRTRKFSFGRR